MALQSTDSMILSSDVERLEAEVFPGLQENSGLEKLPDLIASLDVKGFSTK